MNAQQAMSRSMGSYEAGLNQGGDELLEYIGGLTAADCQRIYDQDLDKVLDSDDQNTFARHAAARGVRGKSITKVQEAERVEDANGNIYTVHRGLDGGVKDEGGFEVDLDRSDSR